MPTATSERVMEFLAKTAPGVAVHSQELRLLRKAFRVIDATLAQVNEGRDRAARLEFDAIPADDRDAYDLLGRGDTTGVFRMGKAQMRQLLRTAKPATLEDLMALVALYRPGPVGIGLLHDYLDSKLGVRPIVHKVPPVHAILKDTCGALVYHEQVVEIARRVAGYTDEDGDRLRRALTKKPRDGGGEFRRAFMAAAEQRGVGAVDGAGVFKLLERFAEYGCRRAYVRAAALVAYRMAYLKTRYSSEIGGERTRHGRG